MKDKIEKELRSLNRKIDRYTEKRDLLHSSIQNHCQTVDNCISFVPSQIKELKEICDKLDHLQEQKELLEYFLE